MSFPRKNGRRRERKRGTRKVSSTSRLRFARRTTPRVRTTPMSISSRVVVVFFLPWAFKAQFRDFLASGCVSNWAKSARAGQHWTGAREGTDAKGIEFDRLGDAECSRVGSRARDWSRVRRCASMSQEIWSIFRTYFQGAKEEGEGGLLYSRISLSEAAAGSVFWREPMSLARRAALRRVVYSPLRFLLFLFLSCNNNNNTEPFFDLCKILQDETRKNGTKAQHSGWRHGEDERSIRLRHWSERRTPPRFQPHRED